MRSCFAIPAACAVVSMLPAAALAGEGKGGLATQGQLVRQFERELAKTPLPGWFKKGPSEILKSVRRMRRSMLGGGPFGQKTRLNSEDNNEVIFGDGRRSVTSQAVFETKPSYGVTVGLMHKGVVRNDIFDDGFRVLQTSTQGHVDDDHIEAHAGAAGWDGGIKDVSRTKARVHSDGRRRWLRSSAHNLGDGNWIMTRSYQSAKTDPRTGQFLGEETKAERYYHFDSNGRRTSITPERYEELLWNSLRDR